jgi:hypothetical protein
MLIDALCSMSCASSAFFVWLLLGGPFSWSSFLCSSLLLPSFVPSHRPCCVCCPLCPCILCSACSFGGGDPGDSGKDSAHSIPSGVAVPLGTLVFLCLAVCCWLRFWLVALGSSCRLFSCCQ